MSIPNHIMNDRHARRSFNEGGGGRSVRPTASFILAQGKAAWAAAALGLAGSRARRLKACLIHRRVPPVMKQAFSLPSLLHLPSQGVALG